MKNPERPNILILLTDQQRFDSLGCNGNTLAQTPHLDALAREGANCSHFFVQHPACMPSRMALLTGRYPSSLGVGVNGVPFPARDALPFHRFLQAQGYHAAYFGKLHFTPHANRAGNEPYPDFSFDTANICDNLAAKPNAYRAWIEKRAPQQLPLVEAALDFRNSPLWKRHASPELESWLQKSYWFHTVWDADASLTQGAWVAEQTGEFLRRQKPDAPFVAVAGFFGPHAPMCPPRAVLERFEAATMPVPSRHDRAQFAPVLRAWSDDDWREIAAFYAAQVASIDENIGQILATLDEIGARENTLVVFTSDHGEFLGQHGRVAKGMPGHDCVARVPFVARFPACIAPHTVSNALLEAVDVVPTLLDFCEVPVPREVQGRSFRALLEGKTRTHRDSVFIESFAPFGAARRGTLRTHTHKYSLGTDECEWLFDLRNDPGETRNLCESPGETPDVALLGELRKRLLLRSQEAAFSAREKTASY